MSYEFPIDYSKVREFARAAKTENPAHLTKAPVIPPTMLTSARNIWEPKDDNYWVNRIGFDRRRILHGEEEYVFHGPLPRAGQVLTAQTTIGDRFEKPGNRGGVMRFAKVVTEFRDEEGTLVASQNSTIIETANAGSAEGDTK